MTILVRRCERDAPQRQTREMPLELVRTAPGRIIEVIWTTGAIVRRVRHDEWGTAVRFDEELVVSDEAVNLVRLRSGAPVLDSHNTATTAAQRAVVDHAWLAGGKGFARIRFPTEGVDLASDRLFKLAQQKIVCNISVGYSIDKVRIVPPAKANDVERLVIEKWTPYELSFVTVPADAGAQVRSRNLSPAEAASARMKLAALLRKIQTI